MKFFIVVFGSLALLNVGCNDWNEISQQANVSEGIQQKGSKLILKSLPMKRLGGGSCSYTAAMSWLVVFPDIEQISHGQKNPLKPLSLEKLSGFNSVEEELVYAKKVQNSLNETVLAIKKGLGKEKASQENEKLVNSVNDYISQRGRHFYDGKVFKKDPYNLETSASFWVYLLDILGILRVEYAFNMQGAKDGYGELSIYFNEDDLKYNNILAITVGLTNSVEGISGFHAVTFYRNRQVFKDSDDTYTLIDDMKGKPVIFSKERFEKVITSPKTTVLYLFDKK